MCTMMDANPELRDSPCVKQVDQIPMLQLITDIKAQFA